MNQDQRTYHRAANAALVGLFTQLLLSIFVALIGLYAQSRAIHGVTMYLIGGLPIWAILWIVFNQHRLERLESLEAEQLAQTDAQAAAIFDEAGQQLQLARKRLEWLYKFGLNIAALVVAVYLVAIGGVWLYRSSALIEPIPGESSNYLPLLKASIAGYTNMGVLPWLLLGSGFVAFLIARYVAGMTKLAHWQLLRGGAGYLMGNVAALVLIFIASVFAYFGKPEGFAVLSFVIPAIMVVLGLEISISFVFGLYRPKKVGETPRPAFDSRILGWLTRPESLGKIISETLNYQFGFEISRSWFYDLLGKAIIPLILIGSLILLGLTSVVVVEPQQNAAILIFGRLDHIAEPGLHFKWPWPVGEALKEDVYRVRKITVGSIAQETEAQKVADKLNPNPAILWTNQHSRGVETYMVTAPTPFSDDATKAEKIAGELAGIELVVNYRINDLEKYIQSADRPEKLLQAMVERQLNAYTASHDLHTLMGGGRIAAGRELHAWIQADVDADALGIEIVFAGLTSVHPPQSGDVAAAFHEQIGTVQETQIAIQNAQQQAIVMLADVAGSRAKAMQISEAIEALEMARQSGAKDNSIALLRADIEQMFDQAGGKAAQLIQDAKAYRWDQALSEQAQALNFIARLEAYRNAPRYYHARLFLETFAEGVKDRRKIILGVQSDLPPTIRINLQESSIGAGFLDGDSE